MKSVRHRVTAEASPIISISDNIMATNAGKEGDDRHGDGSWMAMVSLR